MKAHLEFKEECSMLDGYLAEGYAIIGILEDLDGTQVWLVKGGQQVEKAVVLLLNPDARKYAASLIFESKRDTG